MNIDRVKEAAKVLLFTDIHPTEFSPIVVHHPFTSSGIVGIKENGKVDIINILDDTNLERWRMHISSFIDRAGDFREIFYMINNPYRLRFLRMIMDDLTAEELGHFLGAAYTADEFPSSNIGKNDLMKMFRRATRESLMTKEELAFLDALPEKVRIFRGVQSANRKHINGMSWTLNQDTAKWFAERFHKKGVVYAADISQEHIFAYYTARNESEVVVDPKWLENVEAY